MAGPGTRRGLFALAIQTLAVRGSALARQVVQELAVRFSESPTVAQAWLLLASDALAADDAALARAFALRATGEPESRFPARAEAQYLAAWALVRIGDLRTAIEELRELLAWLTANPDARDAQFIAWGVRRDLDALTVCADGDASGAP